MIRVSGEMSTSNFRERATSLRSEIAGVSIASFLGGGRARARLKQVNRGYYDALASGKVENDNPFMDSENTSAKTEFLMAGLFNMILSDGAEEIHDVDGWIEGATPLPEAPTVQEQGGPGAQSIEDRIKKVLSVLSLATNNGGNSGDFVVAHRELEDIRGMLSEAALSSASTRADASALDRNIDESILRLMAHWTVNGHLRSLQRTLRDLAKGTAMMMDIYEAKVQIPILREKIRWTESLRS